MADSEKAHHESSDEHVSDYSVRYSTRTMLIAMATVAVVCAIAAPFVKQLELRPQATLILFWGSVLAFWGYRWFRTSHLKQSFVKENGDYNLLATINTSRSTDLSAWKLLGLLLVALYGTFATVVSSNRKPFLFGYEFVTSGIIGGLCYGYLTFRFLETWKVPVALGEGEICIFKRKPISWDHIHGIQPTKHPNTFLLRRYDGDLRLTVKPADREAFLALVEGKTGHQL